jgi:hypothetical protein
MPFNAVFDAQRKQMTKRNLLDQRYWAPRGLSCCLCERVGSHSLFARHRTKTATACVPQNVRRSCHTGNDSYARGTSYDDCHNGEEGIPFAVTERFVHRRSEQRKAKAGQRAQRSNGRKSWDDERRVRRVSRHLVRRVVPHQKQSEAEMNRSRKS